MKWQPIETAPRDGTPVLLVSGVADREDCMAVGRWMWESKVWLISQVSDGSPDEAHIFDPSIPTHWMPLPEPPEDT